jgi:tetratricopeptide (TPR) repeat protein
MGRTQQNDNFIDKTFTLMADILLKVFPASKEEKQAFFYYKDGMSAQSDGEYAEALENYYEALQIEEDLYDRSFILYNIGLIYSSNGEYVKALEYYHQALELNSNLPQGLNNIAVIYHYQGVKASEKQNLEVAKLLFDKASEYWKQAINLAPNNYIEAQNWLRTTGRMNADGLY